MIAKLSIMASYRRWLTQFRVPWGSSQVGRFESWKVGKLEGSNVINLPTNLRTFEPSNLPTRYKGQGTVELAIVALFILVPLLVGIADITRAYFEHLAVVDAANVGARWSTLNSNQQYCTG